MTRRLLNLLTALSLLGCVVTCALWVRSRSWSHEIFLPAGGRSLIVLSSGKAGVGFDHYRRWPGRARVRTRTTSATHPFDDARSPVFAIRMLGGAYRTDWQRGGISITRGAACVVLAPDGSADWDSPALPLMMSITMARLSPPMPHFGVQLPHWMLAAAFLAGPMARFATRAARATARRRRVRRGSCPACGYNLTANVTGVCPECGATAEALA